MQLLAKLTSEPDTIENEPGNLEPGLLSVFRMVMALLLILEVVGAIVLTIRRGQLPPTFMLFQILWSAMVAGYLAWSALRHRLQGAYLPIALSAFTVFSIIERSLFIQARETQILLVGMDNAIAGSGWRLFVILLIPLVLLAWQYDFRRVLYFCLGVTVIEVAAVLAILGVNHDFWLDIIALAVARALAFALVGYIVARMMDAQRNQRRKLSDANARLTQYAATLEQLTTSRERNRLARELHDTLAHTLSATSVQLEAADSAWDVAPDKARELLQKSLAQTRSGLVETRRALQDLRASPLEDLGLALAVRNLAESTAKRAGLNLQISAPRTLDNLSPDVEQGVYRITQEALENIAKHSNADGLYVSLTQPNGSLTLTIRDNGQGFEQNSDTEIGHEQNGHYGLQGMRERAEMMGGQLAVESIAGSGTMVQLVVESEDN